MMVDIPVTALLVSAPVPTLFTVMLATPAGKAGAGGQAEADIAGGLGGHGAQVAAQAAAGHGDAVRQGQRDDHIVQILLAAGGVQGQGQGKGRPGHNRFIAVAGSADHQVGGIGVFVHTLAQGNAELAASPWWNSGSSG